MTSNRSVCTIAWAQNATSRGVCSASRPWFALNHWRLASTRLTSDTGQPVSRAAARTIPSSTGSAGVSSTPSDSSVSRRKDSSGVEGAACMAVSQWDGRRRLAMASNSRCGVDGRSPPAKPGELPRQQPQPSVKIFRPIVCGEFLMQHAARAPNAGLCAKNTPQRAGSDKNQSRSASIRPWRMAKRTRAGTSGVASLLMMRLR